MLRSMLARGRQQRRFRGIHASVVVRIVAIPPEEDSGPHHTQQSEHHEGASPRHDLQAEEHEEWRERPTPARAHPHETLRPGAFVHRQPAIECFGDVRKTAGFARPKKKTSAHEAGPA